MVELPLCLGRLGCGFTYRGPISETLNLSVFVQVSFLQFPHVEKRVFEMMFFNFLGGSKTQQSHSNRIRIPCNQCKPLFLAHIQNEQIKNPQKVDDENHENHDFPLVKHGHHHFFLDGSAHPAFFPPGPRPPQAQKALRRQLQQLRSEGEYPDSKLCTPQ